MCREQGAKKDAAHHISEDSSKSGNNQQQIVIFFLNICEPMREYRDIQAKHKSSLWKIYCLYV